MAETNKVWDKNSVLLVVLAVSSKNSEHNGKYSNSHHYDAEEDRENLSLGTSVSGLLSHGMQRV